jgi:hypothetical protein
MPDQVQDIMGTVHLCLQKLTSYTGMVTPGTDGSDVFSAKNLRIDVSLCGRRMKQLYFACAIAEIIMIYFGTIIFNNSTIASSITRKM